LSVDVKILARIVKKKMRLIHQWSFTLLLLSLNTSTYGTPSVDDENFNVQSGARVVESNPLVISMEHSVDGGRSFQPRSKFTVALNAEGKYTVSEAERNGIYEEAIIGFKNLLRNNDFYMIRTLSLASNSSSPYVIASLPACELQKSGFKEDLSVFLGPNRNVVGFSYASPVIALSRSCDPEKLASPTMLLTRLKVSEGEPSMVVPLLAQGPKPHTLHMVDLGPFMDDNLKMHGDKNQQAQGNQSFLRRYWYVVVFLLIYFFMKDDGMPEGTAQDKPSAAAQKSKTN
jgi:hypothetical protein